MTKTTQGSKPATKPKQKTVSKVEDKPIKDVATNLDNEEVIDYTESRFSKPKEEYNEGDIRPANAVMFKEMLEQIYSTDNISLKTELNDRQILAHSKAELFAKRFDIPLLAQLVRTIEIKSVSRNRKGRKESVEISKASFNSMQPLEQEPMPQTIPKRLLGLK